MFQLHQLGWFSFQQLSISVAKEVFGQTISSFLPSKDGGRDGAFTGLWKQSKNEVIEGQYVLQCKFTNHVNRRLKPSDLEDEFEKIEKLVKGGLCDFYILFTNYGVSGNVEARIASHVKNVGVKYFRIFDSEWIIQTIKENNRLRIMVPRMYGLGDLSQILDERVYEQARELLESLKDDFAKVVLTNSYRRAAKAIDEHSFVLLVGGPASGKTTIASNLAIGAMDLWKSLTMKLRTFDEVIRHWNTNDPGQFFWIDDAFGVTRYESNLVQSFNHAMPHVKAMLSKNVRIVMTSRDYIYEEARKDLKASAFPLLKESLVVIDVTELSDDEKRQILYNHLKLGDQPKEFKNALKPYLESVSMLKEFLPETARRLGTRLHTKGLFMTEYHVKDFVVGQREFFIDLLQNLDSHLIAALALIYMNDERLASPLELTPEELKSIERLDSTPGKCTLALQAMNNNLVQLINSRDGAFWKYRHPTIGDAFSESIKNNPELIEIYLKGCDVEKLINQISCGNLNLPNTVIIPKKFYTLVLSRLSRFSQTKEYKNNWLSIWGAKRSLLNFLATRCSEDFLNLYVDQHPEIFEQVNSLGKYPEISPEVSLANRLYSFNLLPEKYRHNLVQTICSYARKGENLSVFKLERIRALFTAEELADLRSEVKSKLTIDLEKIRHENELGYHATDDAEQHMSAFMEVLEVLEEEFASDSHVQSIVKEQSAKVQNWIEQNQQEKSLQERERLGDNENQHDVISERNIFDDVDAES